MTKYQLQASNKWGFDFVKESPITHANSQFKWESAMLSETPKFYHHIAVAPTRQTVVESERSQLFSECENFCPLARSISASSMIIQRKISTSQRKITGELSLIASLWLITPKEELETINSHQIFR
jgi:hypothetical protein